MANHITHGIVLRAIMYCTHCISGLAKVVDWSIGVVSTGREKFACTCIYPQSISHPCTRYRAAEKVAKDKKLRLWKNYESSAPKALTGNTKFNATVSIIHNYDMHAYSKTVSHCI